MIPNETAKKIPLATEGKDSFLPAFPTITIEFQSRLRHRKMGFPANLFRVNGNGVLEIHDFPAALTDEVNVVGQVSFEAVFHSVKLQHLDDPLPRKLIQRGVNRGEADAPGLLLHFPV